MKSSDQTLEAASKLTQAAKAQAVKARKSARKNMSAAKKTSRNAAGRALRQEQAAMSGYGDTAARFIGRTTSAFADAYTWVTKTGNALPKSARRMSLPTQHSVQAFLNEKPLVVGAAGLGLGAAIGAMLPIGRAATLKRSAKKSSRRK